MNQIVVASKTKQIYDVIRQKIAEGKYEKGSKLPSIRDLSVEFNTSKTTINTVVAMLANEGIVEVRDGVGTYIKVSNKCKHIGIMLCNFRTTMRVETDILSSIQKHMVPGYFLTLADTSNDFDTFCEGLKNFIEIGAEGIIIIPPKTQPLKKEQIEYVKSILHNSVPVVFAIRNIEGINADYYTMNLSKGIYNAYKYFVSQGKSRIALIKHDSEKFIKDEIAGTKKACKDFNLKYDEGLFIDWDKDPEVLKKKLKDILDGVEGIIAPDNALYHMQDLFADKKIPEEISIVGINDTLYSQMFNPPLTSITFPTDSIGKSAITTLIDRIENRNDNKTVSYSFSPKLIIRNT